MFRGYWPKRTDDTTGIADQLNRVQKYVFSTTLQSPEWQNTTVRLIEAKRFRSGVVLLNYRPV